MRTVQASEAKARLSELPGGVERAEHVPLVGQGI